jgi:hypothetical protein
MMDGLADGELASTSEIIERIGIRVSPADREALHRAFEALAAEGLVEQRIPVLADRGHLWRLRRR